MQATMKMKHLCLQPLPGEPNVKGMIDFFLKKKPFQSKLQVFVCSFRRFFFLIPSIVQELEKPVTSRLPRPPDDRTYTCDDFRIKNMRQKT